MIVIFISPWEKSTSKVILSLMPNLVSLRNISVNWQFILLFRLLTLLLALKGYYLGEKYTNNKQSDSFLIYNYSTSIGIKDIKVQTLTLLKKSGSLLEILHRLSSTWMNILEPLRFCEFSMKCEFNSVDFWRMKSNLNKMHISLINTDNRLF